ncbi:MAG: hypothetical protein OQK58_04255 [Gammaproteobacteria bacterium]|nr:hypothetical protein [Gammaproteobacteria bacterium]
MYDGSLDQIHLLSAGDYILSISNSYSRSFEFNVRNVEGAIDLIPNTQVSGNLLPGNTTHLYRFDATAGEEFVFKFPNYFSGTWRLFDPQGAEIENHDIQLNQDMIEILQSGTYMLTIEGDNDRRYSQYYSFALSSLVAKGPVSLNASATNIINPSSVHSYTLTLDESSWLVFDNLTTNTNLTWQLEGSQGVIFAGTMGNYNVRDTMRRLAAGDYVLTINNNSSTQIIDYDFRVLDVNSATAIVPGTPTAISLQPGNAVSLYRFTAEAGEQYYFDSISTYDGYWRLIDPAGRQVTDIAANYSSSADYEPAPFTLSGTYLLVFEGRNSNTTASQSLTFNVVPVQNDPTVILDNIVLQPKPDLSVNNVSISPSTDLQTGDTVQLQWTLENRGQIATTGSWTDRIVVRNLDTGQLLTSILVPFDEADPGNSAIGIGESRVRSLEVKIPDGVTAAGRLGLTVITDAYNNLNENNIAGTGESNNAYSLELDVSLAPYPDLVAENVVLTPESDFIPGSIVNVSWTTINRGTRDLEQSWVERVEVRNLSTNQLIATTLIEEDVATSGALAVGGTREHSAQFTWPAGLTGIGQLSFRIVLDSNEVIPEDNILGNGETNNSIELIRLSGPDLTVQNLNVVQTSIEAGGLVTVTWEDWNTGGVATPASFNDRIVVRNITQAEVLVNATIAYVQGQQASYSIASGEYKERSFTFRLPDGVRGAGDIEIEVFADQNSAGTSILYETNINNDAEANNASTTQFYSNSKAYADLSVTSIAVPNTAIPGAPLNITWEVSNQGSANTTEQWHDQIIISTDSIIGNANDIIIGSVQHNGTLAQGESYIQTATFVLPEIVDGNYYIAVVTDYDNNALDPDNRFNNISSVQSINVVRPYADLTLESIDIPALAQGGDIIDVSWTARNTGAAATSVGVWNDKIVLSSDTIFDDSDILLANSQHGGVLDIGESYVGNAQITIPQNIEGPFYILAILDSNTVVPEGSNESNNIGSSASTINIEPIPYADLVVSNAGVSGLAQSGQSLQVSWTVVNQGVGVTNKDKWSDYVFLTTDPSGTTDLKSLGSFTHYGQVAPGLSYERSVDVNIPNGLSGQYYIVVKTGGPYEFIYTDNNQRVIGPIDIQLSDSPDLVVTNIAAPLSALDGDEIDLSWTVANNGTASATGKWTDIVYLQRIDVTDSQRITLGRFTYELGIDAGKTYTRTERFTLPDHIQGSYRITVETNAANNELYEHGTAAYNNSLNDDQNLEISYKTRPDLQVSSATVPDRVSAGGTAAVRFTVINQGSVATTVPQWNDKVYLSLDGQLSNDDILVGTFNNGAALNPGEEYSTNTASIDIPIRFRGDAYMLVVADADRKVDEHPNDSNNILATKFYVEPVPLSDVVTSNVIAPSQAIYGSQLEVRYTVSNLGSAPTDVTNWTDTIWLSHDKTRPNKAGNNAILLGTVQHDGRLAVGESYEQILNVTLPDNVETGTYYITAWSDSYDVVYEDTLASNINPDDPNEFDNNNYKARAIQVLGRDKADLALVSVDAADVQAGTPLNVQWTVENNGESISGSWYDTVWLSDSPDFNAASETWLLGTIRHDGGLVQGQSYSVDHTFDLSPSAKGQYVIVRTDTTTRPLLITPQNFIGHVEESNETNNVIIERATVTRPSADLDVVNVESETSSFSGEKTTVRWTVQNNGDAVWDNTRYWYDSVWISKDPVFVAHRATLLGTKVHSNSTTLGAGENYIEELEVTLPAGSDGDYHIYVITDVGTDPSTASTDIYYGDNARAANNYATNVFEDNRIGNNIGSSNINIEYREPDLKVTTFEISNPAPQSGELVQITYTVTNQGTHATRTSGWKDGIYLSQDPSLDTLDRPLAWISDTPVLLEVGASYTQQVNVRIPDSIEGDFYLVIKTDDNIYGRASADPGAATGNLYVDDDVVKEFRDEGNNESNLALPITLASPPDLQVTSVTAPEHAVLGQNFSVSYTVTNSGIGDTPSNQGRWNDLVYLSRDGVLDVNADHYLGSITHTGGLQSGESYTVNAQYRMPQDLSGEYYLLVITDPTNSGEVNGKVFEYGQEKNNTASSIQPIIIDIPPPADLVVQSINTPATVIAGEPIMVSWTVTNTAATANGSWTDAVYLSINNEWDINDQLLGRVTHTGSVLQDGTYTSTLSALLPPSKDGQYRIIVRPDIYNEVYEGIDEANNRTTSADAITVTVPSLDLGIPQDLTLSTGENKLYKVTVVEGETLRVRLSSNAKDAANEIFVRYEDIPTAYQYDASYRNPLQANQTAVVAYTKPGDYYILVRGYHEPQADTPATLIAESVPLAITSVSPDQGGDSRWVTIDIEGAKFDPQALVKLIRPGIAEYEPSSYEVLDSAHIRAIFDLTDAPHGLYDVKVINPDGSSTTEAYRYLV